MTRAYARLGAWAPIVLSLLRIVTALVLLEHGTQKMFDFPAQGGFGPPAAARAVPAAAATGVAPATGSPAAPAQSGSEAPLVPARPPRGGAGGPPYPVWLMPLAGWIETIGGALLVVGLFSRPVAFILSGETAVIYFIAHAPSGFFPIANGGEAAVLFSWVFFYIVFAGPGPLSLDWLFARRLGTAP